MFRGRPPAGALPETRGRRRARPRDHRASRERLGPGPGSRARPFSDDRPRPSDPAGPSVACRPVAGAGRGAEGPVPPAPADHPPLPRPPRRLRAEPPGRLSARRQRPDVVESLSVAPAGGPRTATPRERDRGSRSIRPGADRAANLHPLGPRPRGPGAWRPRRLRPREWRVALGNGRRPPVAGPLAADRPGRCRRLPLRPGDPSGRASCPALLPGLPRRSGWALPLAAPSRLPHHRALLRGGLAQAPAWPSGTCVVRQRPDGQPRRRLLRHRRRHGRAPRRARWPSRVGENLRAGPARAEPPRGIAAAGRETAGGGAGRRLCPARLPGRVRPRQGERGVALGQAIRPVGHGARGRGTPGRPGRRPPHRGTRGRDGGCGLGARVCRAIDLPAGAKQRNHLRGDRAEALPPFGPDRRVHREAQLAWRTCREPRCRL